MACDFYIGAQGEVVCLGNFIPSWALMQEPPPIAARATSESGKPQLTRAGRVPSTGSNRSSDLVASNAIRERGAHRSCQQDNVRSITSDVGSFYYKFIWKHNRCANDKSFVPERDDSLPVMKPVRHGRSHHHDVVTSGRVLGDRFHMLPNKQSSRQWTKFVETFPVVLFNLAASTEVA